MMNQNKNIKGITLIALVITIIILLILAGVSIAMLTGNNGILTQAKLAKENTALAKQDEENKLANNNEYINEQLGKVVPGKRVLETEKDNYVDSNGDKATVPAGFTVSKIAEEQKVAEGLVIYDIPEEELANVDWTTKNDDGAYNVQTLYNQFVWIPVASEEEYQRDFYYPSYYYINDVWVSSERTPQNSVFTDVDYLPTEIELKGDNSAIANEIAERTAVLKYNGFYIRRYETGEENGLAISKQSVITYNNKTQTEFKLIGKNMYGASSTYVKSAMCSGIQWDMAMKFIDGKTDGENNIYYVKVFNPNRHRPSGKEKCGKNIADKVQNIYDLEGNCVEYIAEKNNVDSNKFYMYRGGFHSRTAVGHKSSIRAASEGNASDGSTFRTVLYVI